MNLEKILLEKKWVISESILKWISNKKLDLNEFLIIVYLINEENRCFDITRMSNLLYITEPNVLKAINSLSEKEYILIKSQKNSEGKIQDIISIAPLLESFKTDSKNEDHIDSQKNLFATFEKEFGRTISSMEYDIINHWIDDGLTEELIICALKEAVYNGVTNLRYIDKILFEWNKKGFKNSKDVENYLKKRKKEEKSNKDLFDYNWLDDESSED